MLIIQHLEYQSPNVDVIGLLIERVAKQSIRDYVQAKIWGPLGTDHDASFSTDVAFSPIATGGFNSTLRDAARFGQLVMQRGEYNGQQVLPLSWMNSITDYDPIHMDSMANNPIYQDNDWVAYHNMWWQLDRTRGEFAATGIHGQVIYINRDAGVVIAYFSSQPKASAARNPNYQAKIASRAIYGGLLVGRIICLRQ